MSKTLYLALIACTFFLSLSSIVFAQTTYVGPGGGDGPCASPQYTHIEDAVSPAESGDTIMVCPGVYREYIQIWKSLTLESVVPYAAVIKSLEVPPFQWGWGIIIIGGPDSYVTIEGFTISGPDHGTCEDVNSGIFIFNNALAYIYNNHITLIRPNPISNCPNGTAIVVGAPDGGGSRAVIMNNIIDEYLNSGIIVEGGGSSGDIVGNIIKGIGPTKLTAQKGVQVINGASASLIDNTITDNICKGKCESNYEILQGANIDEGIGVLFYHADIGSSTEKEVSKQLKQNNTIFRNQENIVVIQ
jgi:nitrous oxidase accessory protein